MHALNAELEQRVADRTAQLEAANRELEAFTYSVSHDLRSPLRSIDGFSLALSEDYREQLDEQGHHYLERVRHATQQMGQLIDDLLNLSRMSRSDMNRRRVDLSAMVERLCTELREAQPDRAVEWQVAGGVDAYCDERLIEVVLRNLLDNALKFTALKDPARIEFTVETQDGEMVYLIRDNGAGFDMAYAGKLFGVFQRLHGRDEFEGTGVGLATVKRIIHRHGGRIWAQAAVEQGATFYFTLQAEGEQTE